MNKAMQNKLEGVEMWCFRRMLKISLVKRVSNVDVLARCNEERSLISRAAESFGRSRGKAGK